MSVNHGRVKSCTQCRQHKLKCDARHHPGAACSRCRKMHLECTVTDSWDRVRPRTKAQLALENNQLRMRLSQNATMADQDETLSAAVPRQSLSLDPASKNCPIVLPMSPQDRNELDNPHASALHAGVISSLDMPQASGPPATTDGLPSASVEDCFKLFFQHYAPFLPGLFDLDHHWTSYHQRSPFLFWTMVCTGARHFLDTEFFDSVSRKVRTLTGSNLLQIQDPIPAIQASLILCLWPLPLDTMWKDPSHALAGAAMQLAIQNGLHEFRHEQDFRRIQINSDDRIRVFRIQLWLHCVIVFQRTSICDGLPFSTLPDSLTAVTEASLELVQYQSLVFEYRIHRVQARAVAALIQSHDLQESSDCHAISALINLFDAQLKEIAATSKDSMTNLTAKCSRLSLLAFHLFAATNEIFADGPVCLFNVCTEVLDLVVKLDATQSFAWHSTNYHLRMVLLAAFCILRIMRSRLRVVINLNAAEQSLFKAINFVKNRSTQSYDLDARYGIILKQLYSSQVAFKREDGEIDGLHLDIRSRLFMSIVFDSFWWWRAEFDNRANPYRSPTATTSAAGSVGTALEKGATGGTAFPATTFENELPDPFATFDDVANWYWPASLALEDDHSSLPPLY